ncbi:MAG: hypothetical protein IJY28_07965 [Clostridia bacterium]|nr:hypothetical protein [Clostridia bacterium]
MGVVFFLLFGAIVVLGGLGSVILGTVWLITGRKKTWDRVPVGVCWSVIIAGFLAMILPLSFVLFILRANAGAGGTFPEDQDDGLEIVAAEDAGAYEEFLQTESGPPYFSVKDDTVFMNV